MKMDAEEKVLEKLGLDFEILDSGCCGMAGPFGFEKGEHYEVSMKAGERVLLPAVREAEKDTLIITDGFSCQEQVEQATDRQALHLSQVIRMGLRDGSGPSEDYPESGYFKEKPFRPSVREVALLGVGTALVGALTWRVKRMVNR